MEKNLISFSNKEVNTGVATLLTVIESLDLNFDRSVDNHISIL